MFDGLTIMILLPVGLLATLDVFWLLVGRMLGGVGAASGAWSLPTLLDIPLRVITVLIITFTSAYITRLRQGFERVRIGVVVGTLGVGVVIILLLQLLSVINIIPG